MDSGGAGPDTDTGGGSGELGSSPGPATQFYEITVATVDQPKLLSRLSDAMVGKGRGRGGEGRGGERDSRVDGEGDREELHLFSIWVRMLAGHSSYDCLPVSLPSCHYRYDSPCLPTCDVSHSSYVPPPLPLPQGDLGLNIREAHVFNTTDGFALDVFVVDGWTEVRS